MRTMHRLLTSALVAASVVASTPVTAHAGWDTWLKPDIKVASVQPSSVSPYHVRVILTNTSFLSSGIATGGFYVWVKVHGSSPKYGYMYIPNMAGNSSLGIDVYVGTNIQGSPGKVTEVRADLFNQVNETNESNNTGYYISPPW